MKKLLLILILFSSNSFAQTRTVKQQTPKQNLTKLWDFNDWIDVIASTDKTLWSLGVQYEKEDYKPTKPKDVIADIDSLVKKYSKESESYYLKKYKKPIDSMLTEMNFRFPPIDFIYQKDSGTGTPIRVQSYNETSTIFFITSIACPDIYNTLKLTTRQRAAEVITKYLIPSIKKMKPIMNKEFNYLGIAAVFGSKDFSSDNALATKAEYILFVVPSKKANDFVKGKITEEELAESADIISSDRDMVTGTKKIKIKLE